MGALKRIAQAPSELACQLIDAFAPVKPYELRWLFHLRQRSIFGGMGSYPRREKAEQKARERADTVPVLDCQSCGALTPGERFRYFADQIICEACDERNPQSRRRMVPRACLQPRDVCVNFVDNKGLVVQAIALDCRTILGPQLSIQSAETLRRLLAYLGATTRAACRLRHQPPALGTRHSPDHTSAVPEEPATFAPR